MLLVWWLVGWLTGWVFMIHGRWCFFNPEDVRVGERDGILLGILVLVWSGCPKNTRFIVGKGKEQ